MLEHIPFLRNRSMLSIPSFAHVLVGEPGSSPGAGLPEHARVVVRRDSEGDVIRILPVLVADDGLDICKLSSPNGPEGDFAAGSG
jgi:hypothetical protein